MRFLPVLAVLALAAPLAAQGGGPFTVVETGQSFGRLQEAVDAIGAARGTIRIASGTYRDCAIQKDGEVAFVAAEPGTAIFRSGICEGKAALVLRGRSAWVEGLIFEDLRVPDGNGAGIRIEKGNLDVHETMFRNSESGILSSVDPSGSIRIERSTFSRLGRCDRGLSCAHSIYIGDYGSLSVVRSRFEKGSGGHYVKSRAPRIEVTDSSFDDSAGRTTNYHIDLPGGATGTIARNMFVQGRDKENYSALITVGVEGVANSSDGLTITANDARLAPGVDRNTVFVADASGDALRIENNKLGQGIARYERR